MSTDIFPPCLRFGIPSLDSLIGVSAPEGGVASKEIVPHETDRFGISLNPNDAMTVCIAGTSGTGKSLLAMHLAARYAADTYGQSNKVIYVSTDYTGDQVKFTWKEFGLQNASGHYSNTPEREEEGYSSNYYGVENEPFWGLDNPTRRPTKYNKSPYEDVTIEAPKATRPDSIATVLAESSANQCTEGNSAKPTKIVNFVDLQLNTAGDDWQFLNDLLLQLPAIQSDSGQPQSKHLLIIDAIEGLEALTGTHDSFGQERKRRSRITQLIRSASRLCHLVFIIEGGIDRDTPEQYAADVVLRLRNDSVGRQGYLRRTLEIEKARGHAHIRGQHILQIRRTGRGGTTGQQTNYDEPATPNSYIYVVPSLNLVTRESMWQPGKALPEESKKVADFGIFYLDEMLRESEDPDQKQARGTDSTSPLRGLPLGTVTALTGDDGTQKSSLLRAFAGNHFRQLAEEISKRVFEPAEQLSDTAEVSEREKAVADLGASLSEWVKNKPCVVVYFTTQDIDAATLAKFTVDHVILNTKLWHRQLKNKLNDTEIRQLVATFKEAIMPYIICRRLERSEVPPSTLFHIIRSGVRQAQNLIAQKHPLKSGGSSSDKEVWIENQFYTLEKRKEIGEKIRVVIEDWQTIRDNYPDVRHDDLFLGFTLFYLRRQGVTTLVGHTRSAQPEQVTSTEDNRLQTEADYNLRTWRIQFGNSDRIAIAAIPQVAKDRPTQIREVKWEDRELLGDKETSDLKDKGGEVAETNILVVDPILEIFEGIREGQPRLVPLRIRFYAESEAMVRYAKRMEELFREMFPEEGQPDVRVLCDVSTEGGSQLSYEHLRDLCHFRGRRPLDHALVFMADDFWSVADENKASRLGSVKGFFEQATWRQGKRDIAADPVGVFQPFRGLPEPLTSRDVRRSHFFDLGQGSKQGSKPDEWDRVPFLQNFSFLLCQENAWRSAFPCKLRKGRTVEEIWTELAKASKHKEKTEVTYEPNSSRQRGILSWRTFLEACALISQMNSTGNSTLVPFNVSRHSLESLSCLVLEMWASEIYNDKRDKSEPDTDKWVKSLAVRRWRQGNDDQAESLLKWLSNERDKSGSALKENLNKGECPSYTNALYRVLLLLSEVLTWDDLCREDNPFHKETTLPAAASRVWYTTASLQQGVLQQFKTPEEGDVRRFDPHNPLVMMQLPGAFTIRGDWFLAISQQGSSRRLAERAVSMLSSFKNNVDRLEQGVGLPARIGTKQRLGSETETFNKIHHRRYGPVRTPLVTYRWLETTKVFYPVPARYDHIVCLMPKDLDQPENSVPVDNFNYFWRSSLKDYDRHARIFQRWVRRELEYFVSLRERLGVKWKDGFGFYDSVREGYLIDGTLSNDLKEEREVGGDKVWPDTWQRFCSRCPDLWEALNGATLADEDPA